MAGDAPADLAACIAHGGARLRKGSASPGPLLHSRLHRYPPFLPLHPLHRSGNIAAVDGQPSVFDPATYYGERRLPRAARLLPLLLWSSLVLHSLGEQAHWRAAGRRSSAPRAPLCPTLPRCTPPPPRAPGHHEAEFGMSWCAGFSGDFWRAYHEVIPRAPGWDDRHALYTLYHYLNHYVLFGAGRGRGRERCRSARKPGGWGRAGWRRAAGCRAPCAPACCSGRVWRALALICFWSLAPLRQGPATTTSAATC